MQKEVRRKNNHGMLGKITAIDEPLFFVRWHTLNGSPITGCGWYSADVIEPVPSQNTAADLLELKAQIDFALDTRNEKKFLELSTKLLELSTKQIKI